MIQSLVRGNLLLVATLVFAHTPTTAPELDSIKQALIGKIAYNQGSWQTASTAFFQLAHADSLDTATYLQLFSVALAEGKEEQLLALSQIKTDTNDPSFVLYQKGAVILQLYLHQNIAQEKWDLLSKSDWVSFFSRIPAKQRLSFLETIYQPDMVYSASARAFMIEMLFMIGLSQEALDLALFPINQPNSDLIQTYAQVFPAGLSPILLAPLCEKATSELQYSLVLSLMELQADRPLHEKAVGMLRTAPWSLEQRFAIARTAIATGHSAVLWESWAKQSFLPSQSAILQMEQCCYDEDWKKLGQILASYPDKNDDYFLYYNAQLFGSSGDIQRALWAFDRIKNPELVSQASEIKTRLMIKDNPAQAMAWAKELIDSQKWGPRELGVLQAQLMYERGYHLEAVSLLEQLVEQEMGYTPALRLLSEYYLKSDGGSQKALQLIEKYHLKEGKTTRLLQQKASRDL